MRPEKVSNNSGQHPELSIVLFEKNTNRVSFETTALIFFNLFSAKSFQFCLANFQFSDQVSDSGCLERSDFLVRAKALAQKNHMLFRISIGYTPIISI